MINLVSYFEIGGSIIECETKDGSLGTWTNNVWQKDRAETHPSGTEGVWIGDTWYSTKAISEGHAMPQPKLGKKRLVSRATRAYRAGALAGTLAAADGPLPIGDALAIGVLSVYAGYETYRIFDELL